MYSKEAFEALTVVELRKIARENGVTLSAGISKQGIVERLCGALIKEEATPKAAEPAPQPAPAPTPAHRVASIVSDDDDTPVMTPNTSFVRNTIPTPAPTPSVRPVRTPVQSAQPTVNRGNVPGTNKPVFSLEGVRAWHNPRNYPQQNTQQGYQQRPGGGQSYGQQRPFTTVSRFGPDAAQPSADAQRNDPPAPESPFRVAGNDQRTNGYGNSYQHPSYTQNSYQSDYRARPVAPAAPASPSALPDMLAVGDISDGSGVLEIHPEGYGFLRMENGLPGRNDIYVSNAQIRRFKLRNGDHITGKVRAQRENDRYGALLYITEINGVDPEDASARISFESLTAVYPTHPIVLHKSGEKSAVLRAIDIVSPIGFGQRAVVTLPKNSDAESLIADITAAICKHHTKAQVFSVLLGKRPEDVTIARETITGEVSAISFDEADDALVRAADMTLERAMRQVEQKKDVVLIAENLPALLAAAGDHGVQKVRRLFGAARALREGGSLTVLALVCEEDESLLKALLPMANAEIHLGDQLLPAPCKSHTRKCELMQPEKSQQAAALVREMLKKEGCKAGFARFTALLDSTRDADELIAALTENA